MRKTIFILLISVSFLTLFTTCKNPGIDYNTFSITKENIQPGKHNVMASGEYDFLGTVMSMKLNIGRDEQLADAESHPMNLDNQSFSITVEGLTPGTSYYYCYVVEFDDKHKLLTAIDGFTTLSDKPKVRTLEVTSVDITTVRVKCVVDDDFGETITERGICWNHTGNPTLSDNHVAHQENGLGEYTCIISGLDYNTTYYVCAFARNINGVSYGEALEFYTETPTSLPSVTTSEVENITATTATGGGTVVAEGSSPVNERGICWSTEHNPTLDNFHADDSGNGLGSYTVEMTNLVQNKTYYVCAYAINEHGPAYGGEVSFITSNGIPIVRIEEIVEEMTGTTAVCKCFVDDAGSSLIVERGVCWSTEHNPTIDDFHNSDGGNELGSYTVEMINLTQGETYYVCAYVKNSDGYIGYSTEVRFEMKEIITVRVYADPDIGGRVSGGGSYFNGDLCTITAEPNAGYRFQYWTNGDEIISQLSYSFTVTSDVSFVAHFVDRPQPPVGAIDGWFTINGRGKKVWFSQGNLQYIGSATMPYWRFAEHQWDYLGTTTGQNSSNQNVDRDLFGWGTSGYHDSSDPYNVNYRPWSTSTDNVNTTYNGYGYGPSMNMPSRDLTGSSANYDWGIYDQITANGNNITNTWRTLSEGEWNYVFNTRSASTVNGVANARYAKAHVNNRRGVILFPDNYTHPSGVEQPIGINQTGDMGWDGNNYNVAEFALMQAAGAVFLPAAGYRGGTTVKEVGICGHYWSVSCHSSSAAYELNSIGTNSHNRCDGLSVRLVCPAEN